MMKKEIFKISLIIVISLIVFSCLNYDKPSDEFTLTEVTIDDEIYHGSADNINLSNTPTLKGFEKAEKNLQKFFKQSITAQYAMRGGKNGRPPMDHAYQYQFCLTADCYAQYFVVPHFDFYGGKTMVSTYNINRDFNSGPNWQYGIVRNGLTPLLNHPNIDSIPELKAIYLLLFDYSSQEITDLYGPFPYLDFKSNKMDPPFKFDSMRSIYFNIVNNIDSINKCLRNFDSRPIWYKQKVWKLMNKYLKVHKIKSERYNSMDAYIRFANSLKLRMAMHVVKVEPIYAQKWAEEAVRNGVIEHVDQEIFISPIENGVDNPLDIISNGWNDIVLNASFESILKSLNHPFLKYLFSKNSFSILNKYTNEELNPYSRIVGMRAGMRAGESQKWPLNPYVAFSKLNKDAIVFAPLYIMKVSEVDFLRAEGAVRGWKMGGAPKNFYDRGIKNGYVGDRTMDPFKMNKVYMDNLDAYMKQNTAINFFYNDPTGATPYMESVTKIGVKWNESDEKELKLEKIITQKYIASFPYSYEAWVDLRRTGYPKVFPVLNVDDGDGSLQKSGPLNMIRRMIFPGMDDSYIKDVQYTGLDALGGPDKQATRLWWDVDTPNF